MLMYSVHKRKKHKLERYKETFGDDRCVYYLDCGTGAHGHTQIHHIVYIKYAQYLISQLFFNNSVF